MKTTEGKIVIEVIDDNGRLRRHTLPIVDKNGDLMTNRLRRVIANVLSGSYGDENRHYVSAKMVWEKPYTILRELAEERARLQDKLTEKGYRGTLTQMLPLEMPIDLPDEIITNLVKQELELYKEIKRVLKEMP